MSDSGSGATRALDTTHHHELSHSSPPSNLTPDENI